MRHYGQIVGRSADTMSRLIRDLLDRLPDTKLPVEEIPWPPLAAEASKDKYGVIDPLPRYPVAEAPSEPS